MPDNTVILWENSTIDAWVRRKWEEVSEEPFRPIFLSEPGEQYDEMKAKHDPDRD